MTEQSTARIEASRRLGRMAAGLRRGYPQEYWARRYGLTPGSLRDLEQGRVLPSRVMVVLLHAIRMQPEFIERAAKEAAADLKLLDELRSVGN